MPVSAAEAARINQVLTTTLARYSPQIANEIARNDGVVSIFGLNGRIKTVSGGEMAIETLDTAENNTIDFRAATADIPTNRQDTRRQAKYAWATLDGAIAINKIWQAMNAGDRQIYDLVEAEVLNAKRTLIRKIADALRVAAPGANNPESILTIVPDTATANQTGSTGELSRVTNSFWRSQFSNTAMDLSANGGLESLMAFILQSIAKGTAKLDQPDFGLTTGTLFAALSAGQGDANRRWAPNDKYLVLGFTNIVVMNATIIADPSIATGDLYLLNTNFLQLQVLKTPDMQNVGERPQNIPVSIGNFQDAYNSLHKAALVYLTFALTCSSLQRQGIATNCS